MIINIVFTPKYPLNIVLPLPLIIVLTHKCTPISMLE